MCQGATMRHQIICGLVVLFAIRGACLAAIATEQVVLKASNLRCENLVEPSGLDAKEPRLGWIVESDQRAQMQTAYRILVATTQKGLSDDLGDLWDSGKVISHQTTHI